MNFHRHSRWLFIQQQSSSSFSSNRFIERSIKRLLEDEEEELCFCIEHGGMVRNLRKLPQARPTMPCIPLG